MARYDGCGYSAAAAAAVERLRADFKLHPREPGIEPILGDELGVGALFDDAAGLQNQDAISRKNRRQPVGDDQRAYGQL